MVLHESADTAPMVLCGNTPIIVYVGNSDAVEAAELAGTASLMTVGPIREFWVRPGRLTVFGDQQENVSRFIGIAIEVAGGVGLSTCETESGTFVELYLEDAATMKRVLEAAGATLKIKGDGA